MDIWFLAGVLASTILHFARYHVTATHFRGVHMWWDSIDGKRYVNLYYRVAWKRDWRDETYCDLTTITSAAVIGPPAAGYMKCIGCEEKPVIIGNMLFHCTDYSALENWSAGVGNHTFNFPFAGKFIVSWQGRGWLDGVHEGHDAPWSALMTVDLRPRPDTARSNNSPRSVVPPIIRLQYGCSHVIPLTVTDPDGDVVRCRWATTARGYDECGGICGVFRGAYLDQDNCTLSYMADNEQGYFAVAIQIEDYLPGSAPYISGVNSLSSVPLQFLVFVYRATAAVPCNSKPELIDPTPEADTCVALTPGKRHVIKLVARVRNEGVSLRDIQTVSILGMSKSEVGYYDKSRKEYYVDVTWTPTEFQLGQHVFCFTAIDGLNISSDQRCIYMLVTKDEPPKFTTFEYQIDSHQVTIVFDQRIKRPSESRYIYVHSQSSSGVMMAIDTSRSDVVSIKNRSLSFTLPKNVTDADAKLYITLEPGAVQGLSSARCGKDSAEIKEPNKLVFETKESSQNPEPISNSTKKDYRWLIVVIVLLIVLFAIAVLVAILVYKKNNKNKYSRKERQEQYTRSIASKVASNGAYEPDFNDIDVKFR